MQNKDLKSRIVELSYKHKLSHLGSCLTAVDIINDIYQHKHLSEPFVLSAGHAGLALYVVLEKHIDFFDAELELLNCGIHPDRGVYPIGTSAIDCSTGSLGQGLPIAIGMALANPTHTVHCLVSDGELAEGSVWESFRIIDELKLNNLEVHINWNGYAAYKKTSVNLLKPLINFSNLFTNLFIHYTQADYLPYQGLDQHYKVMSQQDYQQIMEAING